MFHICELAADMWVSRETSEGSRRKSWHVLQQNPQKWKSTSSERSEYRQEAKPMGSNYKRVNNETVLTNRQGQTDQQNHSSTKLHGSSNSSRQNQGIPAPFQNNRVSRLPLRGREPNGEPPTVWLHQTTEGKRETYKQHIKSRQVAGEWMWSMEKTHKAFYLVRRLNRFWETMIPLTCLTTEKYVRMYVCMYVCMNVWMYVCMYIRYAEQMIDFHEIWYWGTLSTAFCQHVLNIFNIILSIHCDYNHPHTLTNAHIFMQSQITPSHTHGPTHQLSCLFQL